MRGLDSGSPVDFLQLSGAVPISLQVHYVVVNRMTANAKSAKGFHAARAGLNAAPAQVRRIAHDDHVARIVFDIALAIHRSSAGPQGLEKALRYPLKG